MNEDIQVDTTHYYGDYDSVARFLSYFHQIETVKRNKPDSILEIGMGNGTVANYLKSHGYSVDTCDFDSNLNPDFVSDVRYLKIDKRYDMVMACEVLEHIPWNDLDKALKEIGKVTKRYVLISVPCSILGVEVVIQSEIIKKLFRVPFFRFLFKIPLSIFPMKFKGEHYWKVGRSPYSNRRVKSLLKKYFKLVSVSHPVLNSHHIFYLLEKHSE